MFDGSSRKFDVSSKFILNTIALIIGSRIKGPTSLFKFENNIVHFFRAEGFLSSYGEFISITSLSSWSMREYSFSSKGAKLCTVISRAFASSACACVICVRKSTLSASKLSIMFFRNNESSDTFLCFRRSVTQRCSNWFRSCLSAEISSEVDLYFSSDPLIAFSCSRRMASIFLLVINSLLFKLTF